MAKTQNELQACPFCMGVAEVFYDFGDNRRKLFFVQCADCRASSDFTRSATDAAELWNSRAMPNPLVGTKSYGALMALGNKVRGNKVYTVSWDDAQYLGRRRSMEVVANSKVKAIERVKDETPFGSNFKVISVQDVGGFFQTITTR